MLNLVNTQYHHSAYLIFCFNKLEGLYFGKKLVSLRNETMLFKAPITQKLPLQTTTKYMTILQREKVISSHQNLRILVDPNNKQIVNQNPRAVLRVQRTILLL